MSKLEIENAGAAEAGLYLCFLASQTSMGSGYGGLNKFDVIPAYLTVVQSESFIYISRINR